MIEINTTKTEYYNWPLVVAFLESWVRRQTTRRREGLYAAKCWSYTKATMNQEVENHLETGMERDMAVARVWEMFEAACRGQPLVEMGQVMVNISWIGQSCSPEEWQQFFSDLDQTFAAVHRTTGWFTLPVEYRKGPIQFIDDQKELVWTKSAVRPRNLPLIHPSDPPESDPFSSGELLSMILALPQAEFDALDLPASIRSKADQGKPERRAKLRPDYDPEGLMGDHHAPKVKQRTTKKEQNNKSKKVPLVTWHQDVEDDEFH